MIWNPGEGSDLNVGGDGNDTVEVNGGDVAETFSANLVAGRVFFQRTSPGPFSIDIGTSENLVLNAKGGDDTFQGGVGLAGVIAVKVDGGAGNDTLLGTDGNDTLLGGDGNDFIDGNKGADLALMGSGDDVFVWDPGDGSDVVEGQAGNDQMIFNGNDLGENFDLSEHHSRLRLFRDLGTITMDVNDVEAITLNALGGTDNVTIHDLRRTDVTRVDVDLSATGGSSDGVLDNVTVEGSSLRDVFHVSGSAGSGVAVDGLFGDVNIAGQESRDQLHINSLSGNDVIDASALDAGTMLFTADGGNGGDVIVGSAGNDTISGGEGSDILIGGPGIDQLDGGPGFDIVSQ
jgi:Ca2+-binding RTX toxin-like protein